MWQESHLPPSEPMRWQPPHPFIPSIIAFGWSFVVGMAVRASQAFECLPFSNWATCSPWHSAQTLAETDVTTPGFSQALVFFVTSPFRWQSSHDIPCAACFDMEKSRRALPVIPVFTWQVTQSLGGFVSAAETPVAAARRAAAKQRATARNDFMAFSPLRFRMVSARTLRPRSGEGYDGCHRRRPVDRGATPPGECP